MLSQTIAFHISTKGLKLNYLMLGNCLCTLYMVIHEDNYLKKSFHLETCLIIDYYFLDHFEVNIYRISNWNKIPYIGFDRAKFALQNPLNG